MSREGALPSSATSFVGREAELRGLAGAVRDERLVTLHGAGGVGKTRLAIELVAHAAAADGTVFADLGALPRGSPVWPAVAAALGLREEPGAGPDEAVARALAGRRVLLVLDNCEHVLEGAREIARRLLADAPAVTVLATSRDPLGLPGETVWPVPPLAADDAARLFAQRAERALPGFAPRDDDAPAVARICERLDGVPLAIELAAARVDVLGPEEIAERLDDRFRLLAREDPALPPRQRTLRALVDWSHELLSRAEQRLLARLSVFAGGFEVDGAEAVCAGEGVGRGQVVDVLSGLARKALVQRGARGGRARFRLHETIREYAAERVEDAPELSARHLAWCRDLAATADEAWLGEGGAAWLDRMRAEQDNVRAALTWALASRHGGEALTLAWRFANFLQFWGRSEEAGKWLARALDETRDAPPSIDRSRALIRAGGMFEALGALDRARSSYEQALDIGERLGDPVRRAVGSLALADVARSAGDLEEARRRVEEGLAEIRRTSDRERTRWLIECLGRIDLAAGDVDAARERFEASRLEALALGNEMLLPATTRMLGETARHAGDRATARALLEEALGLARRHEDREVEAGALLSLGRLAFDGGMPAEAAQRLSAALALADEAAIRPLTLECLEALAEAHADPAAAAALLGSATALRELLGAPPELRERPRLHRLRATLERSLGPEPFAAEFGAGRARSWHEAVGAAAAPPEASPTEVVLRRDGDIWTLSRPGRDVRLRDSKGLRYLAALVADAGHDIHVLALAGAGLREGGAELLDDAARAAYRRRLGDLDGEIEEAERYGDPERLARLEEERDALMAELAVAVGLGGRSRRAPSSVERARKAVTNRLRDALARVEREDPELGAHLRGSVRMGSECAYRPEPRSPWSLRVP